MRTVTVFILLCLTSIGWAQSPKAVITGPKESVSGDLVILEATQSTGTKYLWKLLESDKSFLAVDNNLKCVFAAGVDVERTFHFVLVVAGNNANGGPEVDITTHDLVVKPRNPTLPPSNPTDPPTNPSKVTRVTYIYEKDNNPIPKYIEKALQLINGEYSGVVASIFEQNTTNLRGETPTQYQISLEAAKKAGIPCLVIQYADKTTKVLSPKTVEEVMEEVK